MTKTSIGLQDLRRRIYLKAKADQDWRFWGLYVHVCKPETLREAYEMARYWSLSSRLIFRRVLMDTGPNARPTRRCTG